MDNQFISLEMLDDYISYLHEQECRQSSITKYKKDISDLYQFLGVGAKIEKTGVCLWKQNLIKKDYSVSTINGKIIAANGLFRFMGRFDCCVKTLKRQKRIFMEKEKDLSKEEYLRLVQTAQKKGKLRLSLVIQTICATGIRISELQFITVEAVKSGYADVNCKGKYVYFQSAFSE